MTEPALPSYAGKKCLNFSNSRSLLVFAEIELLCHFPAERVASELGPAGGTKIVAKVLLRVVDLFESVLFHFSQQLANRLHVVFVEVLFGDLGGIVRGKELHLHHVALIVSGP